MSWPAVARLSSPTIEPWGNARGQDVNENSHPAGSQISQSQSRPRGRAVSHHRRRRKASRRHASAPGRQRARSAEGSKNRPDGVDHRNDMIRP